MDVTRYEFWFEDIRDHHNIINYIIRKYDIQMFKCLKYDIQMIRMIYKCLNSTNSNNTLAFHCINTIGSPVL